MLRIVKFFVVTTLSFLITVSAGLAADISLVIGNRNYQRASWVYGAEKALNSATKLRNSGYVVVSGRDLSVDLTRQALDGFLARLDEAERAVVILNGHFVHSGSDTWFVPVDASRPDLASINYEGLSLNTLLQIASSRPGGAALFLGTSDRPIDLGLGLNAGIGQLDIPQGVFVAVGDSGEIDLTVRRDFLERGVGFAQALANAPDSVTGYGFISDIGTLRPLPVQRQNADELTEEGYWRAVQDMASEQAMLSYLSAYPRGQFAQEAQNWLATHRPLTPQEQARNAELELNLSRTARREIQEDLSLLGYDPRGIDGVFGRGTRAAIASWQDDQNLEATGYIKAGQIARLDRQARIRAEQLAEEARQRQLELEDIDRAFWRSSGAKAGDEQGLRRYLRRHPDGLFADIAIVRLAAIEQQNRNSARKAQRDAWDLAVGANTIDSYQTYLDAYPNGVFADEANGRLAALQEDAAKKAALAAAKQAEADLKLNPLARKLVETQLLALGFKDLVADGQFDKNTRRAIRKFQRTRGLTVTGYLDRQTIVRLIAEAG